MNKSDRKIISNVIESLETLLSETQPRIDKIATPLRDMYDSVQEKIDNMSEGKLASDKGEAIETVAQTLSFACYFLDSGEIIAALYSLRELTE